MPVPKQVFDPPFNIIRSSHVVLDVTDLDTSREFYETAVGMHVEDRDDKAVYFRASEEHQHHSLVLRKAAAPACSRLGFKVGDDSDLEPVRRFEARLVWLSNEPFDKRRGMLFRTATDIVPVTEVHPRARLDLETLDEMPGSACTTNDIVVADISLSRPAALDRFEGHQETGSFVLVDALNGNTLAGGVIEALTAAPATRPTEAFHLTRELLGGVCAGVDPGSHEFRRRAEAVACILTAAGVTVDLGDPG